MALKRLIFSGLCGEMSDTDLTAQHFFIKKLNKPFEKKSRLFRFSRHQILTKKMTSLIKNNFHSSHVNQQMLRKIYHSVFNAPKHSTGKLMRNKGQCFTVRRLGQIRTEQAGLYCQTKISTLDSQNYCTFIT